MNKPNDILSILDTRCTGCDTNDANDVYMNGGFPCEGCALKEFIIILEEAKRKRFRVSPFDGKANLRHWIISYATNKHPIINNLHAITLIEYYGLNEKTS